MASTDYSSLSMELKEKISYHRIHAAFEDARLPFWQETPIMHDHLRNTRNSLARRAHEPFLNDITGLRAALAPAGGPATEMVWGLKMLVDEVKKDIDDLEKVRHSSEWDLLCRWCRRLRWRPSWNRKETGHWCALMELELTFLWRAKVIAERFLKTPQPAMPHEQVARDPTNGTTGQNTRHDQQGPHHKLATTRRPLLRASPLTNSELQAANSDDMSAVQCRLHPPSTGLPASVRVHVTALRHLGPS